MKTRKLLKKLQRLLSAAEREQLARRDSLKKVLKKLRKRRDALEASIEHAKNESECKRIRNELEIVKAQREKGLVLLRELRTAKG